MLSSKKSRNWYGYSSKENEKDVIKLPKIVKDSLNIILADKIDDVLENALVGVEK